MSGCSESGLLPIDLAIEKLLAAIDPQQCPPTERVALSQACGRVLATAVRSPVNVPPSDNSAMDGYAVCYGDVSVGRPLVISQRIPAGVAPQPLQSGTAARIFTGAPVPEGADTVVMQEDCTLNDDDCITLAPGVRPGSHIRRAGEDIQAGQIILSAGQRLRPQDLGLVASVGVADVDVYRPLRVALLVSGDELLEPGQPPMAGKIYNSNQYLLAAFMQRLGFDVVAQEKVADTLDATLSALATAAKIADVIVTTGGVSVGEEDHIKPAVETLGQLDLWKVNIKPGKPFAFGWVGAADGRQVPFLGLPGNPVSVFSTLLILGVPYLVSLQGGRWQAPVPLPVPAGFTLQRPGKRDEFIRVRAVAHQGQVRLEKYANQGSGVLSSTVWAEGFAVIRAGETVCEGDPLPFLRIDQLLAADWVAPHG